jgi:serine phosphatase RsbU (regulator of sigma subunit)
LAVPDVQGADPGPLSKINILLVDDQPNNLITLEALLAADDRNLVKASSGKEALRFVLREDFALILMDVMMPEMDGFETATMIRQRRKSQHTPIIFLTVYESTEIQVFKGYALGGVDYLVKPIVPEVLRAKVDAFVEIHRKSEQLRRQAELLRQVEKRQHERELAEAKQRWETERLREEIRIARQIQQKLFPAAPLPLPGFDIRGASYPAEATGGDYFDYIPQRDGSLGVVIGDVCGHGFGPALLMAELRAYLRAFVMTHADVAEIVTLLNHALSSQALEDRFATLLLARLDPESRSFTYVSAGHLPGYVLQSDGSVKTTLPSTDFPLGVSPDSKFTAAPPFLLGPGEGVLLLTDGIVEANAGAGKPFGILRALALVRDNWGRPSRKIIDALYLSVRDFCGDLSQLDDMTAIVIKVDPQIAAEQAG